MAGGRPISTISRLSRTDPAWHQPRQTWGVGKAASKKIVHRMAAIATPEGSDGSHGLTECGNYIRRIVLYFDTPDGVDLCDACLMGETVYHLVYELRSWSGRCEYVGYSADLPDRLNKHRRESEWWMSDLEVSWTTYDSEVEARAAEVATIRELNPIHNVAFNGGGPRTAPKKANLHVRPAVLTRLAADALGVAPTALTNRQCAALLGVNTSTCYRIRNDPEYAVSSNFVAQVMVLFGGIPDDLFEARESATTKALKAA
jgi:hypothetical protein